MVEVKTMALKQGDTVDDLTFLEPDGTPLRLAEINAPVVLLIFLRHLA